MLGQFANRNPVHPGFGDGTDSIPVDTSGRLEYSSRFRFFRNPDSFTHILQTEIVEHDRFCSGSQCLIQLFDRFDFDLDGNTGVSERRLQRLTNTTGRGNMVFL